ncbi:MAG TPA: TetR/AcrR family transcriptional regulator [Gammaproteobacteria bacterium]|nr:TetR/AcrR family transcriptional regulator [Xanthomonadales bacterium]MCB1594731.1 TetR/AcrR family transcriptional regulator [Xanthomonadales bacterium]MCB1604247.1 TetR/AcrR family transcriptional regulator [Xanthomonadales bacterium]HOP23298.1 TetR/AcrR family transcriptional regulator [Gammaproteobacteria bacterium]HPI96687.1 TetR/AcrR family transcriptional regulator [Gammaproteobacteria bacterium]
MKTKDRIIATALRLFNEEGEPNVTTNHIADEMDISPGNLYYHYRSKDDIIWQIFLDYEKKINQVLTPDENLNYTSMEDMWFYLHMIFEVISEYRFLYRNLIQLMNRIEFLKRHFRRILARKSQTALNIMKHLAEIGSLNADDETIASLADQVALTATFWLNYSIAIYDDNFDEEKKLSHGIFQVIRIVAPFLNEEDKENLNQLSAQYL